MTTEAAPPRALCGATRKHDGGTCSRGAGWGTDHPGTGHCKFHGGRTPNGILFAARQEAQITGMHMALDIEPHEALIACLRISSGQLAFATRQVEELTIKQMTIADETTVGKTIFTDDGPVEFEEVRKTTKADLHIWIKVQQECMDRVAKYAKMAIDAGVEERRVRIAEKWGDDLSRVLKGILDALVLSEAQKKRAPEIVRTELARLEASGGGSI